MQPRKKIFAEAYIIECVGLFKDATKNGCICDEEYKWALDVLTLYFSVVGNTKRISQARNEFNSIKIGINSDKKYIPYKRAECIKSDVSYEELMQLAQQRRSVRWYKNEIVPDQKINMAIELAKTAPSACNRQPFEFLVINDKEIAPKITSLANGTTGFSEQVPCVVLMIGDLSCYATEADRHVIYIDSALASMQFMLALETLGLSSCPINWPEIESNEIALRKEVSLPEYKRVVMMISVGFADEESYIPYSSKKSISVLRTSIKSYTK
ncbi:nitroreductase family protein [Shewanella algae]|nr:nitroreductase family protein [Shewanella algae]